MWFGMVLGDAEEAENKWTDFLNFYRPTSPYWKKNTLMNSPFCELPHVLQKQSVLQEQKLGMVAIERRWISDVCGPADH